MTPEKWEKVTEIFHAASELDVENRNAFLKRECDGDEDLRKEVESLLAAEGEAGDFISQPVVGSFASDILNTNSPSPNDLLGHYRIVSKIGSGGMGEVFLAIDTRLGREVAIKTLSAAFDDEPAFLKRFRNEARAAATLNHPNVATVYSVDEHDGRPFIAMEYVHGATLDKLIPEKGLDFPKFIDWFSPIVDAIAHAHSKGVVHRDIKPGNIMIASDGTPKILDFGLAFIQTRADSHVDAQTDITQAGQILGTPAYMSPEQAEGKEVDHRSDIFSLGVVMYQAVTGRRPFAGDSHAEIVSNLLKSEPEPIVMARPETPEVIAAVVRKCLRKPITERYQLMDEVSDAFGVLSLSGRSSRSFESFQRRLFREARPPSLKWIPVAAVAIFIAALVGWYFFSTQRASPFSLDKIAIRRLSQTNNVALAAIAPDGKSVAYVTYEKNGDRALLLRRVSESNAIQIVPPHPVFYWDTPTFSNDGEYIYYITAARGATHGTMYRIPALGGQPRKVADKVNHLGNLSPDDQRILFVRYGEPDPNRSVNTTDVKLLSASAIDGSDEREVLSASGETIMRDPRFAADGKSIFFTKRELDNGIEYWSLVMLDPTGETQRTILRQRERIGDLATLRGANGLVMNAVDPVSNRGQLFHVGIPEGEVTRITNDISSYMSVSVDREGRNIVSAQRNDEARVWTGNTSNVDAMTQLTREPLGHQTVDWTPNGRIVFDVYENNRLSVWTADADGKNAVQLTPSDSDNSEPRVSGDGRFIVFTSRRGGFNQIWRMNLDGSNPALLANVPGITQVPRFAADGKTVVFRWFNEGSPPLGRVSVEGGAAEGIEGLPRAISYFWAMSPDGRSVAYSTNEDSSGRMKVIVRPTETEAAAKSLDIWPTRIFKWMPDSHSILYQERQRGENLPTKLFQVDPDGREPRLFLATEPDEIFDFSFSRDGRRFAAVRVKTITDAVMLTSTATPERVR